MYQMQGGDSRGIMEIYNGFISRWITCHRRWIYFSVQKKSKNRTTSFQRWDLKSDFVKCWFLSYVYSETRLGVIFFCGKFPRVNSGKIVWFAYIWNQSFEISHYSIKQHHEALVFQKYSLISSNYLLNIEIGQNRIIFAKSRFGPSPKWELRAVTPSSYAFCILQSTGVDMVGTIRAWI